MKHTITFQNQEFEIVVIDGNIVLQSLNRDLVFENGYNEVCRKLEREWEKQGMKGRMRDYVLEHEVEAIRDHIVENETRALEVVYNLN